MMTKKNLTMTLMTPSADPPLAPARPWVRARLVGSKQSSDFTVFFNVGDLLTQLRVQFGLSSDTTAFLLRLHSVRVWGQTEVKATEAVAGAFRMTVSFFDPNEVEGFAVQMGTDVGTAMRPARVGCDYGVIKSQNVIAAGDTAKKIATIQPSGFNSTAAQVDYTLEAVVDWAYASSA